MTLSVVRAFIATTLTCSLAAVGCAAQTDLPPDTGGTEGAPGAAAEGAPSADGEGTVGQVKQDLIACANDVPASGFVVFPYNTVNWTERSGWKPDCVGFRVNRNLPFPQTVPAEAEALGDFPQFEGKWTATKDAQCRASYIDVYFAEKPGPSGNYGAYEGAPPVTAHAEPDIVYDPSSSTLLRIRSCRAQKWKGAGCSWFPQHNYQRIDVKLIVNGNPNNPIGPAKVHAMFKNDTHC
jgi:hypothetical protein